MTTTSDIVSKSNKMSEMEEVELPVYGENVVSTVLQQPSSNQTQFPGNRRAIPISTIDHSRSQYAFVNGLDIMRDTSQLIIQQTIELSDLMANGPSESRYTVKIPWGDTIYYASESSPGCERTCFGSGRSFTLRLYDRTQQEVMQFKRRLACGNCAFWCYLQKLEVWLPPGELIGTISQNISLFKASFNIYNSHNELIFKIEGPNTFGCILGKGENFQIYNSDGATQIGSIIYQWDQIQASYNLLLQMPGNLQDLKHKSLMLATAFLLEYMYYQSSNKNSMCRCMC